jgi:ceramide glucosyltransferase
MTSFRHSAETRTQYNSAMIDIALFLGCSFLAIHIASLLFAWRKCTRAPVRRVACGRITLVRPVCGLEYQLGEALRSSFHQDHADLELIFCAQSPDDPAADLVRRLIQEHPGVDARLLVGEHAISQNPKLNNMAKAWGEANGDLVIFADSNLLLPRNYCSSIAAARYRSGAVLVSSPPVGDLAEGFFGEVECAMLNTHAARWQFAASAVGYDFAQGKTLAFDRRVFGPDLMYRRASEPAEDAAATKLVREMSATLHVFAPAFVHPVGRRSMAAFWARHVRWARLRRSTFPVVFALEAGCGVFPALLAFLLSPALSSAPAVVILAGTVGLWHGAEFVLARRLGWRTNWLFFPACFVRDAFLPAFYIAAWASARFEWRGRMIDGAVKRPMLSQ